MTKKRKCTPWFITEVKTLKDIYATSSREEICDALPRHSWNSIKSVVGREKLRKSPREIVAHPLMREVRRVRLEKRLSQTVLAKAARLDRAGYVKLETSRSVRGPYVDTLERIAGVLGLDVALVPKL